MPAETPGLSTATRIARGALAGAIAGAVASFAMDLFQAGVSAASSSGQSDAEPATEKAADVVARAVTDHDVPTAAKPLAGQAIHYALGVGLGVAYAVAAEFRPAVTRGYGTAFGLGAATLLDEAAVPAVGLGEAPWKADAGTTLYGYASHLVFGSVTELVRRQIRSTMEPRQG